MTAAQTSVFDASTGVTSANLTLTIASIVALIFLIWGAWIGLSQLKLWRAGQATMYDLAWSIIRAAIIMLLLGYLIR